MLSDIVKGQVYWIHEFMGSWKIYSFVKQINYTKMILIKH